MILSNLFLSWTTQRILSWKEERSCGQRRGAVPREATLSIGRARSETADCDWERNLTEDSREFQGELGPEGSESVRIELQTRQQEEAIRT